MSDETSETKIYRYEVPVDGQWHEIHACSTPLHIASRERGIVEFWAWHRPDLPARHFRVYGTGQPVLDGEKYRGTAVAPGGLVWHLMERL
ncbi:DUF7352 domain-containing protein [Nonomuraea polychroma]|uniref:DUF7352 domain-containing protein n=1 Tax=Nonomuraea polychroma TaxID=46176 RepID=UPI003D8A2C39